MVSQKVLVSMKGNFGGFYEKAWGIFTSSFCRRFSPVFFGSDERTTEKFFFWSSRNLKSNSSSWVVSILNSTCRKNIQETCACRMTVFVTCILKFCDFCLFWEKHVCKSILAKKHYCTNTFLQLRRVCNGGSFFGRQVEGLKWYTYHCKPFPGYECRPFRLTGTLFPDLVCSVKVAKLAAL